MRQPRGIQGGCPDAHSGTSHSGSHPLDQTLGLKAAHTRQYGPSDHNKPSRNTTCGLSCHQSSMFLSKCIVFKAELFHSRTYWIDLLDFVEPCVERFSFSRCLPRSVPLRKRRGTDVLVKKIELRCFFFLGGAVLSFP